MQHYHSHISSISWCVMLYSVIHIQKQCGTVLLFHQNMISCFCCSSHVRRARQNLSLVMNLLQLILLQIQEVKIIIKFAHSNVINLNTTTCMQQESLISDHQPLICKFTMKDEWKFHQILKLIWPIVTVIIITVNFLVDFHFHVI